MADDFQEAFQWHMEQTGTKIADLCRDSGVSRDVINKLMSRPKASTSVENGMLIAAYFGKNINQFIAKVDVTPSERLQNALDLLQPAEQQLLEAQIHGLLARRGR